MNPHDRVDSPLPTLVPLAAAHGPCAHPVRGSGFEPRCARTDSVTPATADPAIPASDSDAPARIEVEMPRGL